MPPVHLLVTSHRYIGPIHRRVWPAAGQTSTTPVVVGCPRPAAGVPSAPVTFRPVAMKGAPVGGGGPAGIIDYRLARNAVLSEFRKGRLRKVDVCDAHPELVRAARNVGQDTGVECPVCEQADLVTV